MDAANEEIAGRFPAGVPILRVVNKIDLAGETAVVFEDEQGHAVEVRLSARGGEGIDLLRASLLKIAGWQPGGEDVFLARERHLSALRAAAGHLALANEHAEQRSQSLDLFAEELRLAQDQLNSITGAFGSDDLLGVIFSRFCIGK
jgi:tRNA modification GTPase